MRILHVVTHLRETGNGIVNSTVDLACLQAARHEVTVAAEGGDYVPLLSSYGVRHVELSQRRSPRTLLRAAFAFRRIVRDVAPDVVHVHTMTAAGIARVLRLGSAYGIVATVHNEFQREATLMGVADLVTANSAAVAKALERRGIPKEKLRVVSIGALDGPRRRRYERPPAAQLAHPAIVTVAGMYVRKGIDVLIAAFERLPADPPAHLYLVGDGPDREAFERQARASAAADRIHFTGFEAQPERYVDGADVFVLASRKEPFGMVISEAREAGIAVIASDVDGIPEALDGGRAGILVAPDDPAALAAALERLLTNPEERRLWAERAREGLERFTAQRYCDDIESVYRELPAVRQGRA